MQEDKILEQPEIVTTQEETLANVDTEQLQADTQVAISEIKTELKKAVDLQSLTDIYFDTLIANISDDKVRSEIAFVKNKLTFILSMLN